VTTLLLIVGTGLLVITALPLFSFLRLARVLSEMRTLRARLAALEDEVRTLRVLEEVRSPARIRTPEPGAGAPVGRPDIPSAEPAAPAMPLAADAIHIVAEPPPSEPQVPPPIAMGLEPPAVSPVFATPWERVHRKDEADALEAAIGGRLLLYVGTLVIVLGIAYFLKYAFERQWITEGMRVALGAVAGLGLVAAGQRLAGRGYGLYGQMLVGGGLAALYLSVYAAFGFYGLIGRTPALLLLLGVTVAAALLADRHRSQAMALMAVGGGFLTPFLVGGTEDRQIALFTYVALLIGGTMYLARRRGWPWLNVLAYACTILVVAAWADAYYVRAKYLRTELFLTLYCVMFLAILRVQRPTQADSTSGARLLLWTAPAIYHAASLGVLAPHGIALLVYLIAFALVGIVASVRLNGSALRLVVWGAAWLPLVAWLDAHNARVWVWPGLVTLAAIFALAVVAQLDRVFRRNATLDRTDLLLLHLNGLGTLGGIYVVLAERNLTHVLVGGVLLALVHLALASRWRENDTGGSLNALAVCFTLVAAIIAIELDGTWLTAAWAAEGAGIMAIGVQLDRRPFRIGGGMLLAVAAARWILLSVGGGVPVNFRLVFNTTFLLGAWIVALAYVSAWWHRRRAPGRDQRMIAALVVGASVLTIILLSTENASFWNLRGDTSADARFAERLWLSIIWALYAGVLIAVGFRRQYRPIRYTAIALFALTIAKVFLVDLASLQGIYRVLGLIVVGTVLLLVSFLYQRRKQAEPQNAE
jgi:uncharacterized membrane protein